MDQLYRFKNYVSSFFSKPKITKKVSVSDWLLCETVDILQWYSPEETLVVLFFINCYIWFLSTFFPPLAGIPFTMLLIHLVHYNLPSPPEIQPEEVEFVKKAVASDFNRLQKWVIDHPMTFDFYKLNFWLLVIYLADAVGDTIFLHIFSAIVFAIWPVVLLHSNLEPWIVPQNEFEVLAEEDLILPVANRSDLNGLDTDTDSLKTDGAGDLSLDNMIAGITVMPSYWEVTDVTNEVKEEDLIPQEKVHHKKDGELSSDSDSENRSIQFDLDARKQLARESSDSELSEFEIIDPEDANLSDN